MDDRQNHRQEQAYASSSIVSEGKRKKFPWNRLALILIVFGGILFAAGWAGGSRGGNIFFLDGRLQVRSAQRGSGATEHDLPAGMGDVRQVQVIATSMNVTLLPTDTSPRFVVYGGVEPMVTVSGDTLTIDTRQQERNVGMQVGIQFNFATDRREIRLYLPQKVYNSISLTSTSGNVRMEGFTATDVTARSTSGNVRIRDSVIGNGTMQSTSGRVELTDTSIANAELRSTSGNVIIDGGALTYINASTTSGNIRIDARVARAGGHAELRSTSGTIRFTGNQALRNGSVLYTLQSRSGNVRVNGERVGSGAHRSINHDASLSFTAVVRTTSGNIHFYYN
ncbi:MAG: DUF4097 domain-containing protein [Defluviitaleaceae bacterium]|nr:DUF4097 domain-containing protein [Defluviitaleaceae bacterium]MCL2239896.1 DUF4097 domain-containing protein [Defluviitaleaceae bacterium]